MPSRRELIQGSFGALAALALPGDVRAAGDGGAEAAHPNMLWYEQPAREWTEALPVGNGRIGAMVFGGVARERLQLNEDTLWAGGPVRSGQPGGEGRARRGSPAHFRRPSGRGANTRQQG